MTFGGVIRSFVSIGRIWRQKNGRISELWWQARWRQGHQGDHTVISAGPDSPKQLLRLKLKLTHTWELYFKLVAKDPKSHPDSSLKFLRNSKNSSNIINSSGSNDLNNTSEAFPCGFPKNWNFALFWGFCAKIGIAGKIYGFQVPAGMWNPPKKRPEIHKNAGNPKFREIPIFGKPHMGRARMDKTSKTTQFWQRIVTKPWPTMKHKALFERQSFI